MLELYMMVYSLRTAGQFYFFPVWGFSSVGFFSRTVGTDLGCVTAGLCHTHYQVQLYGYGSVQLYAGINCTRNTKFKGTLVPGTTSIERLST
eukprot:SAG11_NODE_1405_length_5002_cov_4.030797_2_plen_92_part_00